MYQNKTLVCKECGKEFVFSADEQAFFAEKGFENERAAPLAVLPVVPAVVPARCSRLYATSAAALRRFPSSPPRAVRCTAAIASRLIAANFRQERKAPLLRSLFCCPKSTCEAGGIG